jgi:hypothetical protein
MVAKYAVTALLLVSSEAARVSVHDSVLEADNLKSQAEATQESNATSAVVEEHAQSTESVQNATSDMDLDLDAEFEYELSEPMYAVDGCANEKDSKPQDMKDKSMSHHEVAAVRCCTDALAGSKSVCHSKNVGCLKQTYDQAEASCARHGMRLCSWFEMKTNLCCGTGCNFDSSLSWIKRGSYAKRPNEYNPNTRPGVHCRDKGALESFFQSFEGGWFSHHDAQTMASKYCQNVQVHKLKTLQAFLKSFEGALMSAKDASKKAAELLQANPHMDVALFKKQVAYYKSWEGGMQSATVAIQKASDDVRTNSGSHSGSTARRLQVEKEMISYLKSFDAGMYSQPEAERLAEQYAQFVSLDKLKPMVTFFKSFQAGMMRSTDAVTKALRLLQQHPHVSLSIIESKTAHYRSWNGGMKDATTAVNLAIEDAIRETHYSWDHHSYDW